MEVFYDSINAICIISIHKLTLNDCIQLKFYFFLCVNIFQLFCTRNNQENLLSLQLLDGSV